MENQEKIIVPSSGWIVLMAAAGCLAGLGLSISAALPGLAVPVGIFTLFLLSGFVAVEPNSSRVCTLFGKYVGTIKTEGFQWVNPFYVKRKVSLRARNLESSQLKVNDKSGNPIIIGAVIVWRVQETFKAAFEVENYEKFVTIQSEAAVRQLAGSYAYDNHEDEHAQYTLRESSGEINRVLEQQISDRVNIAGIEVIEARISHLSYAPEIAGAMLQRQQAQAVVAARKQIVEGAVGMVEMALDQLSQKKVVHLDEEKKASMVSNLLVVLCSEKSTTPVVSAGNG
jgi:regulator of protease activity HflC (stomatin/prohibitin superfamily)